MVSGIQKTIFRFSSFWMTFVIATQFFLTYSYAEMNKNCVSCELLERWKVMKPARSVLSEMSSDNLNSGWNVASIVNHPTWVEKPSPLEFIGQGKIPELPSGQAWWDGQGDLPNAFQRPWEFPKSNFDPSFITPYYSPVKGPLNVSWAPWNLGVLPSDRLWNPSFLGSF